MIVTTAERPSEDMIAQARALAAEWGVEYVPRRRDTLAQLRRKRGSQEIAVVGPRDVKVVPAEGEPLFYHPSMGLIRVKRLMRGEADTLVEISGVREGDFVLDCTAGLCADSLVLSYMVGDKGHVVALEASPIVHAIVREGLKRYASGIPAVDKAMRAIVPVRADYESYLAGLADRSVDIVYFDPMFEQPVEASASLAPLRAQAKLGHLTEETVREASRVARRCIVLKDHRGSGQFERLGFRQARNSSSSFTYGVIKIEQ